MLKGIVSGVPTDITRIPMQGKNLVNVTAANSISAGSGYGNYTINDTNHTITSSGDAKVGFIAKVEPSTQYTVKALTTNKGFISVSEFDSLPTEWEGPNFIKRDFNDVIANSPYTFTTTADTQYVLVGIYVGIEGVGSVVSNIMLNLGSSALPYEPYGMQNGWEVRDQQGTILWAADKTLTGTDSIPLKGYDLPLKGIEIEGNETQAATQGYTLTADSASIDYQSDGSNLTGVGFGGNMSQSGTPTPTVPITPEECGERTGNLFDYIAYFGSTFVPYNEYFNYAEINLQPNTTYTLSTSFEEYGVNPRVTAFIVATTNQTPTTSEGGLSNVSPVTITTESDGKILLYKRISGSIRESLFPTKELFDNGSWLMLNTGSSPLPYEPYGYKIPFQNGNASYNIYLKEPLRKIGDYKDSVGVDGVVTRRVKKLVLTGQETLYENWRPYSGTYGTLVFATQDAPVGTQSSGTYCTHLQADTYGDVYNGSIGTAVVGGATYSVAIRVPDTVATDDTTLKQWLASEYSAGHPVEVWYVLATPVTESTTLPTVSTTSGSNTLTANTTLAPSSVTIAATSAVWPGNPIQPEECGDLVTTGQYTGKYVIPLTLAGTTQHVYLDAPLRKIGTYADKLNADGTVTRRIKKLVFDGTEDWNIDQNSRFTITLYDSIRSDGGRKMQSFCNQYECLYHNETYDANWTNVYYQNTYTYFFHDKRFNDLVGFKAYLASQYSAGHPVEVWYVLETAQTEQTTIPTLTPNTGADTLSIGTSLAPSSTTITGHIKPRST